MATAAVLNPPRKCYETLADLAKRWGIHPATFTRHILKGVDPARSGKRIKLEAIYTGGRWLVPQGADEAFFAAVTAAKLGTTDPAPEVDPARERELAGVDARLAARGLM